MTEIDPEKEEEEVTPTEVVASSATSTTASSSSSSTNKKKKLKKNQPIGKNLIDKNVQTSYGTGIVLQYRESDEMYVIKLTSSATYSPMATVYTPDTPTYIKTIQDEIKELNVAYEALEKMRRMNLEMECFEKAGITDINYSHCSACLLQQHTRPIIAPYNNNTNATEAGEGTSVRRPKAAAATSSSTGTRSRFPRLQNFVDKSQKFVDDTSNDPEVHKKFPRLSRMWGGPPSAEEQAAKKSEQKPKTVVLPRIQKLLDERQMASASPCLICASMSCSQHSSQGFRKEGITLCLNCERLFELDFIVDCVSTPDEVERAKHIDHMVDCYDRCLLLLKYSTQYVDQIANSLATQKEQVNKVGLASSGVGVLSGVLGIAAAATILTPVGPPLLISSLFFGGSATAVQTGAEAMNYFSEPNKLADRIIALHGMILSILRVTSTLRDAMLRDHIRTDVFEAEPTPLSDQIQGSIEKNRLGIAAGANVGRSITLGGAATMEAAAGAGAATAAGVAGAEAAAGASAATSGASAAAASARGAAAGARGVSNMSRAGTAAARTMRFARFAGGALSAAVLVLEANAIQSTLKDIQNGNPCDKADRIRQIGKEISERQLPSTSALDEECQAYLQALANRPTPPPEAAAVVAGEGDDAAGAEQFPQAECHAAPPAGLSSSALIESLVAHPDGTSDGSVLIIEGDEPEAELVTDGANSNPATLLSSSPNRSFIGSASSSILGRIQTRRERRQEAATAQREEVVAVVADLEEPRASEVDLVV